jgi:FlaA1/EpsC-like NDP-sugar epimerase
MSKPPLLLIGAGGHARACIDVVERHGEYAIAGLVGMPDEVGDKVLGYLVLGTDNELQELNASCRNALITVGQVQTPEVRTRLFSKLCDLSWKRL